MRIAVVVAALSALYAPFAAAQSDTVPPDVLAVQSFKSIVDVRNLPGCTRASCGEPWAGPTPLCSDVRCTVNPVFVATVKDTSGPSAAVSGVGRVTLRFANPRAVAQGVHATTADDGVVDLSLFQLVTVTIPQGQTIGDSALGAMINLFARFNGYSLSGTWVLDSIRVSDQAGNVRVLQSADLAARGLKVSILVASLQVGHCKGACGSASGASGQAGCVLYSSGGMDEAWWDCDSDPSLAQTPGVCCSPCTAASDMQPLEVRGVCNGAAVVSSPLCGCYGGNASSGWNCSFDSTAPASMQAGALCPGGVSPQCSGVGGSGTCGPYGSHALGVQATSTPAPVQGGGAQAGSSAQATNASLLQTTPPPPSQGGPRNTSVPAVGDTTPPPDGQTPPLLTSNPGQSDLGVGFLSGILAALGLLFMIGVFRRWRSRQAFSAWLEEYARIMHPRASASIMPPDALRQRPVQRRRSSPAALFFPGSNTVVPLFTRQGAAADLEAEGSLRRSRQRGGAAEAVSREDLRVLRSMGFPLPLAAQALAATRMQGAQTAAAWIIENGLHDMHEMRRDSADHVTAQAWPEADSAQQVDSHSWSTGDTARATREAARLAGRDRGASLRRVVDFGESQDAGWNSAAHARVRGSSESGADRNRLFAPLTAAEARQHRRSMRLAHAQQHPLKQKSLNADDFQGKSAKDCDDGLRGECCVCMDRSVEARLVPCGHTDMCMKCAAAIYNAGQPCPLCRTTVEAYTRIQGMNAHRKS